MDWTYSIAKSVVERQLPLSVLEEIAKVEFCASESSCIDFKRQGYESDVLSCAEAIIDIASFFNAFGGYIVFGVEEVEKDVRFRSVGITKTPFDMQLIRGKIDSWLRNPIDLSYSERALSNGAVIGVLSIPKRNEGQEPNTFKKRGPEVKPGKFIFDHGDVPVRRQDQSTLARGMADWQLVLGPRKLDSIGAHLGVLLPELKSVQAIDNNLPSRSVICAKFVGRNLVLAELWAWLNDTFQYYKVIAGDGGKGKTSVAYEFCTQVAQYAPLGIKRIVWLTAKKRQFSGIGNDWINLPETHFSSFVTMLQAIGTRLGYESLEMSEASDGELRELVRSEISIVPTLFVLDDIDSLIPDEQKMALEFAQQCGSKHVRFLLTARSNATYSSTASITLAGLEGDDFHQFVGLLSERFGVVFKEGEKRLLSDATSGSPLLTESIIRVVRRGVPLHKAISDWKGHAGEDARNAVLGREIDQLSREAKRVLLCIAFFGQCSHAEISAACGLLSTGLEAALDELQNLFIVSAPRMIESEPRFDIGLTAALLVDSKRSSLAGDHVAIERRISEMRRRARAGSTQKSNAEIGYAISQAVELGRSGKLVEAIETIDRIGRKKKDHPDLLLCKGRLLFTHDPSRLGEARALFARANIAGCKKHILFDLWFNAERQLGSGHGVIEVCEKASTEFPGEEAVWRSRKAEGHVLNGVSLIRLRETEQAYGELTLAAKELFFASRTANWSDRDRYLDLIAGVHDQLLEIFPNPLERWIGDPISAIREIVDRGDLRTKVLEALVRQYNLRAADLGVRSNREARDRLLQHRDFISDLIRPSARSGLKLSIDANV